MIVRPQQVKEALIAYVTRAGEKLRRDHLLARQMRVFIQNSPFATKEPYYSNASSFQLPDPTSDTAELIRHACPALERIFRPGFHYAKCGVMLTEFCPAGNEQRDFFDDRDEERCRKLMETLDAINHRMGRDTVYYAGSGIRRDWRVVADLKTCSFSTDYRQILKVGTSY